MQVQPANLEDLNFCCQMKTSYSTDYVWQMQTNENERAISVRFNTVRLPRLMRVSYPRSPDELAEHWQKQDCFLVVRDLENEVAAFIDARPQSWQNLLWISNLIVQPHHRRQGFGTALLKATNRWALAQNLGQIMIEVQTKNYPAISFALKHGFQYCGYNESYYPNGDIALFFSRSTH